jgi:shikimate dehydrogenase
LLGAGGAARGALQPFLAQQPSVLIVANRTVATAKALAERFAPYGQVIASDYDELSGQRFDVVVNATSTSLTAELPPVPAEVLKGAKLAYELVYGKGMTPFLRLAQNAGVAQLADGVGMLAEQAAEAFAWWRGVRPDTRSLIDRMTIPLV